MSVPSFAKRRAIGRWSATRASVAAAIVLGTLVFGSGSGRAALLRLRSQCQSGGAVVTLGDVAEIVAADAEQARTLASIELFPAPPSPRQRFVRLREIQDLLLLRGVNLAEHQFSGSSQVTVLGGGKAVDVGPERSLSPSAMGAANRRVIDSVARYLRECVSADRPWVVEAELDLSLARLAADPGRTISIAGGAPPWTGRQRFEVSVDSPDGPLRFPLDAQVEISPLLVVAARSLPRGVLIHAADVELQQGSSGQGQSAGFRAIDEVLGKETTQTIPKGKVLQQEALRAPLLVRRGDVVTVYARNQGICVRTLGRARDNGSAGELVAVESLQDRSAYFARVCNVQEVEVYARPAQADRVDISGLPPAVRR